MAGRPTRRTPTARERVLKGLQQGLTKRAACAVADLDHSTLTRWCQEDEDFAQHVEIAECSGNAELERVIRESAIGFYAPEIQTQTHSKWIKVPVKDENGNIFTDDKGKVVMTEERITWTETTETKRYVRDTRLGLEMLARRNPEEWAPGLDRQIRRMKDEEILALILASMRPIAATDEPDKLTDNIVTLPDSCSVRLIEPSEGGAS